MGIKLSQSFFFSDTAEVAKNLLGKTLITLIDGQRTAGLITETEAYLGTIDRACHTYGGKRSKRTEPMYQIGGTVYIYLCYGIHHLFNIVTRREGEPEAVLIRSIQPLEGAEIMSERRGKPKEDARLSAGPGSLSRALGLDRSMSGKTVFGNQIWLEDRGENVRGSEIISTARIGVGYAGEHANWPLRFYLANSKWVSKPLTISYPLKNKNK